jgi:hypothetical protein
MVKQKTLVLVNVPTQFRPRTPFDLTLAFVAPQRSCTRVPIAHWHRSSGNGNPFPNNHRRSSRRTFEYCGWSKKLWFSLFASCDCYSQLGVWPVTCASPFSTREGEWSQNLQLLGFHSLPRSLVLRLTLVATIVLEISISRTIHYVDLGVDRGLAYLDVVLRIQWG